MHLGYSNPLSEYRMKGRDDIPLQVCSEEKDLGVLVDSQLLFSSHVDKTVNKAQGILGAMRRSFQFIDVKMFSTLYKAMVRPHLEYANVVWSPHLQKNVQKLEKVQRRATKLVPSLTHLPYRVRLQQLKLPSLAYRRDRGDMIQVYKIITGINHLKPELFFDMAINKICTRGHSLKLNKTHNRLDIRKYSFSQRVINNWNSLPESVGSAESLNLFKNKLDEHWKDRMYA